MRATRLRGKKLAGLMLAVGFSVSGVLFAAYGRPAAVRLTADCIENPADGLAVFRLRAERPASLRAAFTRPGLQIRVESGRESVRVIDRKEDGRTAEVKLQTTLRPGAVTVRAAAAGFADASLTLRTVRWLEDRDGDGLPDAMRLDSHTDQESFRRWFALLAESQYYKQSPAWDDQQKDCSGLVRFAWREALRPHTAGWHARVQPAIATGAPDIAQYQYPHTPLGDRLFRTRPGPYAPADLRDDTFSGFADANTLRNYNSAYLGKDPRAARQGDLLFYYQPGTQQYPYHLMVFLGDALIDGQGRHDWVVYHTGPNEEGLGVVKKVTLEALRRHPSPRWWPVPGNPHFLGFYRPRILD